MKVYLGNNGGTGMKKIGTRTAHVYDAGGGFHVDIFDVGGRFEAWLWHTGYGISSFMFGWPKEEYDRIWTMAQFVDVVEKNLEDHKELYKEEYMD